MKVEHSVSLFEGDINKQIIHRRVYDGIHDKELKYSIKHSKHSLHRSAQRSINNESILDVLDFGISFHRQGLVFYAIKNNNLPTNLKHIDIEKTKNLVVVMNGDETQIITCYRSKNALKSLRQKCKELSKAN